MLLNLVRRNIMATKGRLALMLLSIVLGVSFVSGSFLIADSLRSVFADISEETYRGVDVVVRQEENELSSRVGSTTFDDSLVEELLTLEEIEYLEGSLFAFDSVFLTDSNGEVIRPMGPPVITQSWAGPSPVSSLRLIEGEPPGAGEIAIDSLQAQTAELSVGDTVAVLAPATGELAEMTLSAIVDFGTEQGASGGAYVNTLDLATLQRLTGETNQVDTISINARDDVKASDLIKKVEGVLSEHLGQAASGFEVVTGQTIAEEQARQFDSFVSIFGNVLLGFAVVVLFVSAFIIYNTFAILISQRIRQLGLLRAIGATGTQLTKMVFGEAVVMGILASILGLIGGVGIAYMLRALFDATGGALPTGPILFQARTVIVVLALGVGVTVISAIMPARTVARVSPLKAMQEGLAPPSGSRTKRIAIGAVVTAIALALMGFGLFGSLELTPRLAALGVGSALLFIGMSLLSVLFASVSTGVIGAPLAAIGGLSARLGRDNAQRNPQRSATTATALMIGLALITGVLVLTQSLRESFNTILEETIVADVMIYDERGNEFSAAVLDDVEALEDVKLLSGQSHVNVRLDGEVVGVTGWDSATSTEVVDIKLSAGEHVLDDNSILVYDQTATSKGYALGDSVNLEFEDGSNKDFVIGGIFSDKSVMDRNWVLDRSVLDQHRDRSTVSFVAVGYVEGSDAEAVKAQIAQLLEDLPQLKLQDNTEFKEQLNSQISQLMGLVFGLLGLCIVVAFIGIVNTMALSVLERTREIGLLRAVGTTRSQVRKMVRTEAVIVALFGSVLGVVLGLAIGTAAVTAIPDNFVSKVAIPWGWVFGFLVIGAILGMVAAIMPARRAAKMDVLEAISTV